MKQLLNDCSWYDCCWYDRWQLDIYVTASSTQPGLQKKNVPQISGDQEDHVESDGDCSFIPFVPFPRGSLDPGYPRQFSGNKPRLKGHTFSFRANSRKEGIPGPLRII